MLWTSIKVSMTSLVKHTQHSSDVGTIWQISKQYSNQGGQFIPSYDYWHPQCFSPSGITAQWYKEHIMQLDLCMSQQKQGLENKMFQKMRLSKKIMNKSCYQIFLTNGIKHEWTFVVSIFRTQNKIQLAVHQCTLQLSSC